MAGIEFEESGMLFAFDGNNAYHIEKSATFAAVAGRMTCECVVLHRGIVTFIEAKKSSPRVDNRERFGEFIADICTKFTDSFAFYCAVHLRRHKGESLPQAMQSVALQKSQFEFYLVINGHNVAWMPPVMESLKREMKKMLKIWGIRDSSVKVINEQIALRQGLIKACVAADAGTHTR